jgi:hypothetical protein
MKIHAWTLAAALCAVSISKASAQSYDPAVKALAAAAIDEQQLSSAEARLALVKAAASYRYDLGRQYRRNSPAEEAWLKSEIAGGGDRPEQAIRSAEFGRLMAANFVDGCSEAAAAYDDAKDKSKALVWLAYIFARFAPDAKYYADKNGVNAEAFGLDFLPHTAVKALLWAALQEKS